MIRSDIEDQDVVDNISHNAVYLNDRKVDTFDLCHQLPGYFIDSLTRGLSDNGLLEIAGIHVDVSSAATSCTEQFHASTLGHPFPGRHGQNLRRLRIHQARIDNDGGLALFLADLTQAKPLAKPARADFFCFEAKLRNRSNDNGIDTQNLPDSCGRGRIYAVAHLKILFRQYPIKLFPFDHRLGPVANQIRNDHVCDALADVPVPTPPAVDSAEFEVKQRNSLFFRLDRPQRQIGPETTGPLRSHTENESRISSHTSHYYCRMPPPSASPTVADLCEDPSGVYSLATL